MKDEPIKFESLGEFEELKIKHLNLIMNAIKDENQVEEQINILLKFY